MGTFAQQLTKLIHQRGWNQNQAAEMLGVSQANISRWLSGEHEPSLSKAMEIATTLGVSLDQLIGSRKTDATRVQESEAEYATRSPLDTALDQLQKRYRKAPASERDTIKMALIVLFPSNWKTVLGWLEEQ